MSVDPRVLRSVLETMSESVSVYDLGGRVRYANGVTERLLDRTLAEVEGRELWELFPDAVGNTFHAAFLRVASGGPEEALEAYYPPWDRWFAIRLSRVDDAIHVISRDVTDDLRRRRRLEAQARISEVFTAEIDPKTAPALIAEVLTTVLDADTSLAILSQDRAWLELVAQASRDPGSPPAGSATGFPSDVGHPGEALRTRTAVLTQLAGIESASRLVEDPRMREAMDWYRPSSLVVAPLFAGDDTIGVLMVIRRVGERPLSSEDVLLVTEVTAGVGLFLAHARRRAEALSLRHRLAAITDSHPACVSFVDREGRYQYVNATYERWFECAREDLLGRRVEDVLGPAGWSVVEPRLRRVLAGELVRYRAAVPYPTGTRDVDAHYVPIFDEAGDIEGFAVVVIDLSGEVRLAEAESRRAEEERRATERLQSLVAVTGQLAGTASADGIVRVVVDDGIRAMSAVQCGIWLVSPDGRELCLRRQQGLLPWAATFERVRLDGVGPLVDCVRSGEPVWIDSRAEYAARYGSFEAAHRPPDAPPLAFALLPLVMDQAPVGCLLFAFHEEQRLTPNERFCLRILASHTIEALRRARLYAEVRDASETREAMIHASPAAIVLRDEDGRVQAWNPAAERMLGWRSDEVLGRPVPGVGEDDREVLRRVFAGEVISGREVRRVRKSGEVFDAELHVAPVRLSDGRTLCLSMVVDISERKRIERGRVLVAGANAILTRSLDRDETLLRFVERMDDFADLCLVDLLGDDGALHRVAVRHAAGQGALPIPRRLDHGSAFGGASAAIATRVPQILADVDDETLVRLARDEQHLRWLRGLGARSLLSVPLLLGDRCLGALSFASTSRNFDDVDVGIATGLGSHAATAIENARLYEQARSARRDAEAASQAKDQFLAMLGHELRNPLAPIATVLDLMKLRSPNQLEREREVLERQVTHLIRLVDDLLDVSRITRGKIELRRERVSISAIVGSALELTSPLLELRKHRLTVDVPSDLTVYGDRLRLSQVVANLVSNAARYTEPEGLVRITAASRDDTVVLSVADDGIGIAPEMLPSIFDLFVQAPQGTSRPEGGLGLGLAIVRSLVDLHGGTVTAHSDGLGRGTELVVTLPAGPPPTEAGRERTPDASPMRAEISRRILVVDDNRDAANFLGEALDACGHQIRTAFDGASALAIAEEFQPEVAVLDLGLPVMDGYELARRLRATSPPPLRLIAVTGYGQDADRARARDAGFDEHLTKPVPLEKLVRLVTVERTAPLGGRTPGIGW